MAVHADEPSILEALSGYTTARGQHEVDHAFSGHLPPLTHCLNPTRLTAPTFATPGSTLHLHVPVLNVRSRVFSA